MLPSSSIEIHQAASKMFTEVIQKDLIPVHIFTTTCMSPILAQLDNKDKCKGERERERGGVKERQREKRSARGEGERERVTFLFPIYNIIGISNSWLLMVLSGIPYLPKDIVKRHILTTALAKGQLSQTVNSRQASCKIIGALASKFEPYW